MSPSNPGRNRLRDKRGSADDRAPLRKNKTGTTSARTRTPEIAADPVCGRKAHRHASAAWMSGTRMVATTAGRVVLYAMLVPVQLHDVHPVLITTAIL